MRKAKKNCEEPKKCLFIYRHLVFEFEDSMDMRLYVLELQGGKYYVGQTKNLQKRFQEHLDGAGSVWTRKHAPLAIASSVALDGALHEDRVTKELMLEHGIDNVRGGSYCRIDLDDGQYNALTTELRSATGTCFECGRQGHFAAQCPAKRESVNPAKSETAKPGKRKRTSKSTRDSCLRCGRSGHFADTCYAKTDVDGDLLSDSSDDADSCFRCGRSGHFANACYAKTDVDGDYIDSD